MDDGNGTLKNVKTVPPQKVMDVETGEAYTLQSEKPEKADENFYKIFMKEFKKSLSGIKSQKLQLILWLIEHMSLKNELKYSYREIAKEAGMSLQTVLTTIRSLEENDFLCRNGKKLMINPNVVFKGRHNKRSQVFAAYMEAKKYAKPLSGAERRDIEDELDRLKAQVKKDMARRRELEELEKIQKNIKTNKRRIIELREKLEKSPREKEDDGETGMEQESTESMAGSISGQGK